MYVKHQPLYQCFYYYNSLSVLFSDSYTCVVKRGTHSEVWMIGDHTVHVSKYWSTWWPLRHCLVLASKHSCLSSLHLATAPVFSTHCSRWVVLSLLKVVSAIWFFVSLMSGWFLQKTLNPSSGDYGMLVCLCKCVIYNIVLMNSYDKLLNYFKFGWVEIQCKKKQNWLRGTVIHTFISYPI